MEGGERCNEKDGLERESERQTERRPASVKQGWVSRFKEGFSHYDSATVYCILQRPYYNGLLAFMLPFTSQVQHLHGKQGQDLRHRGLAEDHNARADDLGRGILFRVRSHRTRILINSTVWMLRWRWRRRKQIHKNVDVYRLFLLKFLKLKTS